MPRSYVGPTLDTNSANKETMNLNQLSPQSKDSRGSNIAQNKADSILTQTLSPKRLKLYAEAMQLSNCEVTKLTQNREKLYSFPHQEGLARKINRNAPDEIYTSASVGVNKVSKQSLGLQHGESKNNPPKQTKYQSQSKKAPSCLE